MTASQRPIMRVIALLEAVRRVGGGYIAKCPCSEKHTNGDAHPSLSITEGDDARVLLICRSQHCAVRDVVAAIGLKLTDLFADGKTQESPSFQRHNGKSKVSRTLAEAIEVASKDCGGQYVAKWAYENPEGTEALHVVRFRTVRGKEFRPFHRADGGYVRTKPPGKLPLYGVTNLHAAHLVYLVEGEACVEAARSMGMIATTSAFGAQAARETDWTPLAGKTIVILPDNDNPGRRYATAVATILTALKCDVKIVDLPNLPDGGDIVDFLQEHDSREADDLRHWIEGLAASASRYVPHDNESDPQPPATEEDYKKKTQADLIVELAENDVELFHAPDTENQGYARVRVAGHFENWCVSAKPFRQHLAHGFHKEYGKVPGSQAIQDALNVIAGEAVFGGPEHEVAVRLAEHGGDIWLDLGDPEWRAVQITKENWRVVSSNEVPVRFIRKCGMLPLPVPVQGGSIEELRQLVNLRDEQAWIMFVAWVVAALRPRGPYPILIVNGEQGSAKSTLCRFARAIVDPNKCALRRPPRQDRDLMIAAINSWVIAYDNLSGISANLSDALCMLATGGGFGTRMLYSDDEEKLFDAMRPVMFNGIDELGARPDLLDRAVTLTLTRIIDDRRQDEDELFQKFENIRPRILGSLLDAVSMALRNLHAVKLPSMPRMADFAKWVTAAEPALGWEAGSFLNVYLGNRANAGFEAVESSPVGPAILGLMHDRSEWSGIARELLTELEDHHTDEKSRTRRDWPSTPKALANLLRRIAPSLPSADVVVHFHAPQGHEKRRLIVLEKLAR